MADEISYPDPVQPGNIGNSLGSAVVRQRGLPPDPTPAFDPTPPKDVIQPDAETKVTRQQGVGFFAVDGTFFAEGPADDGVVFVDGPMAARANQMRPTAPAPLAPSDLPMPPPQAFASDEGAIDPRDASSGPHIIGKLPVIKKRAITPIVLPTPKVRRVKAKAGAK
jgi:hypothetical protein